MLTQIRIQRNTIVHTKTMSMTVRQEKNWLWLAAASLIVTAASPTQAGSLPLNHFDQIVGSVSAQVLQLSSQQGAGDRSSDGTQRITSTEIGGLSLDSILRRDVYQTHPHFIGTSFSSPMKAFTVPEPASTSTTLLGSAVFGLSWLTRRVRGRILSMKDRAFERRRNETREWLNTLLEIRYREPIHSAGKDSRVKAVHRNLEIQLGGEWFPVVRFLRLGHTLSEDVRRQSARPGGMIG